MKNESLIKQINSVMPTIVDKFVGYYGEKYRPMIEDRISKVKFIFDANPESEYRAIKTNCELYTEEEIKKIKNRYYEYEKVVEESLNNSRAKLFKYLKDIFSKYGLENDESLLGAFSNYGFEVGAIDSFSSASLELLKREDIDIVLKDSIIEKQKWMLDNWLVRRGITKEIAYSLSPEVDKFIDFRKKLNTESKMWVVENFETGRRMVESIEEEMSCEIDVKEIVDIFFRSDLCALSWTNEDKGVTGCIIHCPWSTLMLKDDADESLIHELIHAVESKGVTGITDDEENNVIANEILTQMIAKKITKELHDDGVFIVSKEKNVENKRSVCYYEKMFPLVLEFFTKYESVFKRCKIENDLNTIEKMFGDVWKTFSVRLDEIYNLMLERWIKNKAGVLYRDEECEKLIEAMENHYKSKNNKK